MREPGGGHASFRLGRVFRAFAALVMLSAAPISLPASAQDCSISRDGWDDIQRFRGCIEEHGVDARNSLVLHNAACRTTNPTIDRLTS